jgi:hypothetical protein
MIITESEAQQGLIGPVQRLPEQPGEAAPSWRNLLSSAMRVQNTVISAGQTLGSALERRQIRARRTALGEDEPGYNPLQDIQGYEPHARAFRDAESREDVIAIKRRIDRENEDRRTLEAGGIEGMVAQIAAGTVDPVLLIPVGGSVARSARLGEDVAQGALRAGRAGAVVSTAAEGALQATQETRTAQESAIAIGASALLSGILGGAAPLVRASLDNLSARTQRELTLPPSGSPDPLEPGILPLPTTGSAGAMRVQEIEARLKGALGMEKLVSFASPILRTVQSPSVATRRAAVELTESPFYLADNVKGIATPVAVETRVKMWQAPLAEALEDLDRLYVQHRQGGGELSFKAFKEEVGKAMRRQDTHPLAEVQEAARTFRRKLYDPTKKEAIAVKLLPEDVQVIGADSYLSRVYDIEKISARRTEFVGIVTKWLKIDQGGDHLELRELAEEITDHILGAADGRIPYEAVPLKRGPARERVLNIPDVMIEDFLESDIELVSRFYSRTLVPDIELARTFGRADMKGAITRIVDDYKDLIAGAKSEAERTRLAARRDADIRDLEAMRDRLRGTYAAPADPNGFFVRGARAVRNWNYLSLMGAMTESSIPDLARPVMVHGVLRTLRDGVLPMITNFRQFRLAAQEAKRAGAALDMVLDSRAMELADIGDIYGRHSAFERGMQALVERFGKWALMTPWNAALKQFSSVITQHEILAATSKGAAMSKRELEKLAMSGIDAEMAGRIAQQFNQHGERGSAWLANTRQWTDRQAIEAFRAAVVKDVDRTIVTPGIGDRPLWMSTELGKVIGQFKSFAFASAQRVLLAGLQQRDMAALNGTLLSIALGMGVYGLKSRASGKETSDDPAVWVREGVDRSGVLGWLYEAGNVSEKFTRGLIGPSAVTGGEMASRYASRGVFGALFGPTVGRVEDIAKATGAAVSGEFSESDVRALRRLVPYQNLFYLRDLFDKAQEGASDVLVD